MERVIRDRWGIPHLWADSVQRLAELQGRIVATDRAWQLDHLRRRGEGRLAEVFGPPATAWDVLARRARFEDVAVRALDRLDTESRAFLDAYVRGVNDGLGTSPEHRALDCEPAPWHPWTPISIFLAQHFLFGAHPWKLWRQHLRDVLGPDGVALLKTSPVSPAGSNAFAVAGSRTATGHPIVAGDPHRAFEAPNVYAQVHLACPEFDTVGFCFPGVPGVQHFGHNGSVAWGITNAAADAQDLYLEDPASGGFTSRSEVIEVRGADPVVIAAVVGPRGPVIVDDERTVSMCSPAFVDGDAGFAALLPLLRSRTSADVEAAFASWVEPVNNVVVADREGDVRRFVAGRVPRRPPDNMLYPVAPDQAWTGYVDPLPRGDHAHDGFVVSANQRVDESYDVLGISFSAPDRAERLAALIRTTPAMTVDDASAIMLDTYSRRAHRMVDDHGWDGHMDATSGSARDYLTRRDALVAAVATHPALRGAAGPGPFGPVYGGYFWMPDRVAKVLDELLERPDLPWGLDRVLAEADVAGAEPSAWPRIFHPVHAFENHEVEHPLVDELHRDVSVPLAGDATCVAAFYNAPGGRTCRSGPVARYVWDLADRDRSSWVVPLGADGAPGAHRHDQTDLWANGRMVPVISDWSALEALESQSLRRRT